MTVLLSSAGRRVGLLECFRQSAEELTVPLRVLACDMAPEFSAACAQADGAFRVSPCSRPGFVEELVSICTHEKVDLLVPTIDTELEFLSAKVERFARIKTLVAVSEPWVVALARNKLSTAMFFREIGIPVPRTATLKEFQTSAAEWNYPVVAKPAAGSASVGVIQITDVETARKPIASLAGDYVVQERCKGSEYTVNMFFDHAGLRCAIPHRRMEVRAGEVSKARTERLPALFEMAENIGAALKGRAFGALCFQAIVDEDERPTAIEMNARFGGGYPLAHQAGATFTKWLLEIAAGRPSSAHNNWRENLLMLRYDAAVFRANDQAAP